MSSIMAGFPQVRLRRLRASTTLRRMLAEVRLSRDELIAPLFVRDLGGVPRPIASMPGQFQFSVADGLETVRRWAGKGLPAVLLFGLPEHKDAIGSGAWDEAGAVQELCRRIKKALPDVVVITDVCLCEYTDHGHCGPLAKPGGKTRARSGRSGSAAGGPTGAASAGKGGPAGQAAGVVVDNDAAIESLARVAVSHARSGADIVAPSAMMDGQVAAIRQGLDAAGFGQTAILSYAVKFASSMYGPFREAADCAPQFGDRRTYQLDFRAPRQAAMEARLDAEEGADLLMVKPAWTYLDVIAEVRRRFDLPLAAYHVSGEYACLKAAAANGWLDEKAAAIEVTTAIKRAGADLIITYFAEQLAEWL
jgi:porphobilinogen synthase